MKNIKVVIALFLSLLLYNGSIIAGNKSDSKKIIVAYVTSWSMDMPNPIYMTHINYAFGHVNEAFNGIKISNEKRLREIIELKKKNEKLKVSISIGGWGSGGFSEMAASRKNRRLFAKDCSRVIKEFNLDGIDIDWEYPTSSAANISASPEDTKNFTLLMQDIRKAIGKNKLLTIATVASADYIDFKSIIPFIDFVNVMSYDMASVPKHHSALYKSENSGYITSDGAVNAHINAGVPTSKIVMGMPFYGRGGKGYPNYQDYKNIQYPKEYRECWDEIAQVPYLIDKEGDLILGFDNKRSIALKCQYILNKNLLGGMYWEYSGDNKEGDLSKTVYDVLMNKKNVHNRIYKVVVLTESAGQHKPFSDEALKWLIDESKVFNMQIQVFNNAKFFSDKSLLDNTDLIIQLDFPPYTWPKEAEDNFTKYINEGRGGWIGFHHATLLGEFDGFPLWNWFSDFMGGIRFDNYIAPLADGKVIIEDTNNKIMNGVDSCFVVEDDEWYTYNKSPRSNVHVLARVDESTYSPASNVKMGDHPVIWTNENIKAKNIYFQMGHSPKLFKSDNFTKILHNAILWVLGD